VLGSFNVTGGVDDFAAPTIVSVSVSPQVVTVGGTVFISFQLADVGGLSFVALFWQNSFRGQVNSCPNGGGLSRSSGDAFNATYESSCTLPSFGIPSGLYSIHIRADDTAGNTISTVMGSFNVTGGVDDFAAPNSNAPSSTPTSNYTFAPSPVGGHDLVLVLFSDDHCTSLSNSPDVTINPFQAGNGTCKQWPYSAIGDTMFATLTCGLSGVEVAMFHDSGCHQPMHRSMMPKDSCVRMPSAFGINGSNSFIIKCGHFGPTPAVSSPPPMPWSFDTPSSFALDQATGSAANATLKPIGTLNISRIDGSVDQPASHVLTVFGNVYARHLSGNVTAAHIHGPASASANGPVVVTICGPPSSVSCNAVTALPNMNQFEWAQPLPSSGIALNATLFMNGLLYLNVHTALNANGELRGQLDAKFLHSSSYSSDISPSSNPFPLTNVSFPAITSSVSSNIPSVVDSTLKVLVTPPFGGLYSEFVLVTTESPNFSNDLTSCSLSFLSSDELQTPSSTTAFSPSLLHQTDTITPPTTSATATETQSNAFPHVSSSEPGSEAPTNTLAPASSSASGTESQTNTFPPHVSSSASGSEAETNAFPHVSSSEPGSEAPINTLAPASSSASGTESQTNTFPPVSSSEAPSLSSNRRLLQHSPVSYVSSAMFISSTSVKCFVPRADFGGR
jgi:hypothetical protein